MMGLPSYGPRTITTATTVPVNGSHGLQGASLGLEEQDSDVDSSDAADEFKDDSSRMTDVASEIKKSLKAITWPEMDDDAVTRIVRSSTSCRASALRLESKPKCKA